MELHFRTATASDFAAIKTLVIDSFEPITWQKKLDQQFGALNGLDWRERWNHRLEKIFASQIVLVGDLISIGEQSGQIAAMATATVDHAAALAFIDVLAVGKSHQGEGLGRLMLQGIIAHVKSLGCRYVNLDCLTDNDAGNALYQSAGFTEVARHIRWFKEI